MFLQFKHDTEFCKSISKLQQSVWEAKTFKDSKFSEIEVPGHIQIQGFDQMQYINVMYPWDGRENLRPPYISKEYNPVGSYVKEFELEESLKGKKLFSFLPGCGSCLLCVLNGSFVGYSEDSFTPAEFDITTFYKG